jgi:CRP-like cAMP-binding protein
MDQNVNEQVADFARKLSQSHLFFQIPKPYLHDLVMRSKVMRAAPGSLILHERELVPGIHVILDGVVEIVKKTDNTQVATIEKGGFFGEISIFGQSITATATARSQHGCIVMVFTRNDLEEWFRAHPEAEAPFFRNLATELCSRLKSTTERLVVALTATLD